LPILIPGIKLYRKLFYRKGYGVHSPFAYNLITKVIEEKAPFYAFEDIETFRKNLLSDKNNLSSITGKETQHPNYGAFLFRMVNFFKCQTILQIGCSTGVMSLYLAFASRTQTECYAFENRPNLLQPAKDFALAHNLNKLYFIEGNYSEQVQNICNSLTKIDLLFINQLPDSLETEKIIRLCESFVDESTIFIINDIATNKDRRNLWKKMKNHPQSRVSMDLYALGVVFFNKKLPKRHYKVYFNHGKKQNLHKSRRRRLYLIGRRKKSS